MKAPHKPMFQVVGGNLTLKIAPVTTPYLDVGFVTHESTGSYLSLWRSLSPDEADAFFVRVCMAIGIRIDVEHARDEPKSDWRLGVHPSGRGILIVLTGDVPVGVPGTGKSVGGSAYGIARIRLTREEAYDMCVVLAPVLGWELTDA